MSDIFLRVVVAVVLVLGVLLILVKTVFYGDKVNSYGTCVDAGHRVLDGNPPKCIAPDGTLYEHPSFGVVPSE